MDVGRSAEIVDSLPSELRVADIAAVLGVSVAHVTKQRGLNRVPKPYTMVVNGRTPVWQRDSLRAWLIERLVCSDADLEVTRKAGKASHALLGNGPAKRTVCPTWPFQGI